MRTSTVMGPYWVLTISARPNCRGGLVSDAFSVTATSSPSTGAKDPYVVGTPGVLGCRTSVEAEPLSDTGPSGTRPIFGAPSSGSAAVLGRLRPMVFCNV
jgi:hypothetical protein